MVRIELQDPLSTEVKSPTIAGAIEALNHITKALDLNPESVERAPMNPVPGLDSSDPRRIYQVEAGNRLWLDSSTPEIYVNGSRIYDSSRNFTIDYIGGSITFTGSYRPSSSDVVTASFNHISSEFKVLGGSEIIINFSSDLLGQPFTVTGGENETHTGVVDSSYKSVVRVKGINTTYIVSIDSPSGEPHTAEVEVGPYYGKFEVSISSFSATIKVTAVEGAIVTASMSGYSVSGKAGSDGTVTLTVANSGNYTVSATYSGAKSNSKSVQVSRSGQQYTTSVNFITLTVTAPEGSTITVKNGGTTLSDTGGTVKFWLPNTGTWTVTASLNGDSSVSEVQANEYTDYSISLEYVPESLNDATWEQIGELSSSGKAKNYFSVGDSKTIHLSGQIPIGSSSGYDTFNTDVDVFIIGFDHNPDVEGTNKTTFCLGKKNGKMVALSTSGLGKQASQSYANYQCAFCIWPTEMAAISWDFSTMYLYVLSNGSSYSPQNPRQYSLMAALPSDLRSVMKQTVKYVRTMSSGSVVAKPCNNYLFLFSEPELRVPRASNPQDRDYQERYEYFSSGNAFYPSLLKPNGTIDTSSYSEGQCPIWTRDSCFVSDESTGQNAAYTVIQGSTKWQMTYQYMIFPILVGFCV